MCYTALMRALLAFDKFKDSMSASEACAVAASMIRKVRPNWEVELCPVADGSDGFAEILTQARAGSLIHHTVMGPSFKPVEAHIGVVECASFNLSSKAWLKLPDKGTVVVIEMAQASGLMHLSVPERNLWYTSSFGTGELLKIAIDMQPEVIVLGVGGSATHDLGLGALEALGVRFRAENGDILTQLTPHLWDKVVAIEGELPKKLPRIIVAPNVQNKLLGQRGAAALFGPQKGLKPTDLNRLEAQTLRMAELIMGHFGASRSIIEAPGSGAAGGMMVGLQAALKVEVVPGIELTDRWVRLNEKIERANIVITGEGRFDMGTLEGKAPQYVIERASHRGKRIYCLVGQLLLPPGGQWPANLSEAKMTRIAPEDISEEESMESAIGYLGEAVRQVAEVLPED